MAFPAKFLWGTASSAHQVEGDCDGNSWSLFETLTDPEGRSRIQLGHRAGKACEQWTRFREDIGLMKAMALNAYRFSVEWSKIEPREGEFNEEALAHYDELISALLDAGIEPVITLHHFTDPNWFSSRGGFLAEESPEILARFARIVFDRFSSRVRYWCTINEPAVYAIGGYITGEFPPAVNDPEQAGKVLEHLLRAHAVIYHECKARRSEVEIGLPTNVFFYQPASSWNPLDRAAAYYAGRNFNDAILDYLNTGRFSLSMPGVVRLKADHGMRDSYDFVGINYYTRFYLRFNPFTHEKIIPVPLFSEEESTDMGWEIYPDGITRALQLVASYTDKPIYITENGIADDSDTKRERFIRDHLCRVQQALQDGIDVRGYFFWTLLDNFEWAHGYTKRFGLYRVDFATQERVLRAGSKVYRDFIKGQVVCNP